MNSFPCVYSITNPLGQCYIGSTKHYHNRWKSHKSRAKSIKKNPDNVTMSILKSFNKYGFENHVFTVLEYVPIGYDKMLIQDRERHYQEKIWATSLCLNDTLVETHNKPKILSQRMRSNITVSENCRKGLVRALKGRKLSNDHKNKISDSLKNRVFTDEHRKKLSASGKGRVVSNETRQKIREGNSGKKASKETKQKLSESMKKRVKSKEYIDKLSANSPRSIRVIDTRNEQIFTSIRRAAKANKIPLMTLVAQLKKGSHPFLKKMSN